MTYNVFSGTLNLTQSISQRHGKSFRCLHFCIVLEMQSSSKCRTSGKQASHHVGLLLARFSGFGVDVSGLYIGLQIVFVTPQWTAAVLCCGAELAILQV